MNAIVNENSIGLYVGGQIRNVDKSHPRYQEIREAIKQNDEDAVIEMLDYTETINKYGQGKVTVVDGLVYHNGVRLNNHLTTRLAKLINEGFGVENLTNFISNLYENPNNDSIEELYQFLENFGLPLTDDGCFLAYKAITNDYLDIWSRTISNKIGCSPEMDREAVEKNRSVHCAPGLHCGSIRYVKSYGHITRKPTATSGNRLMLVKVNPRDAVSVPTDGCEKLRTCKYTVIAEMDDYDKILDKAVYTCDAKVKEADDTSSKYSYANKVDNTAEPDALFFEGRRDGLLDAHAGVKYSTPPMESKKYCRGYKHGYKKAGVKID